MIICICIGLKAMIAMALFFWKQERKLHGWTVRHPPEYSAEEAKTKWLPFHGRVLHNVSSSIREGGTDITLE